MTSNVRNIGANIIVSTTPSLEGKRIVRYLGIVTGEASAEVSLVSDKPVASFSDAYHQVVPTVRDSALRGAIHGAEQSGANAIVGAQVNYVVHGSGKGMVMVSVIGTAVICEDL